MQAVLMAGGKGTRMRPFTESTPKPLIPLGSSSILELVLRQLSRFGFERVQIAVGHKAELIMATVGDGSRFGLEITCHVEDSPLGTIGAVACLENLDDDFLVVNADICTNLDFRAFFEGHLASGAGASVAAYTLRKRIEAGVLTVNGSDAKVVAFEEAPMVDLLVSMGVNAFNRSVLDLVPRGQHFGFDDLMHRMLAEGVEIRSVPFDGLWHNVSRPADYQRALDDFEARPGAFLPGLG